ncbi:cysteine desulfurase-like protein [Lacipirellula limnantheis]|uniref:Putative cysteine desulfurase n=1 Tax=Lacipirellula limnantheis TaxID=2528024 RepID=A0A517TT42_9BACT|nr:cysteine desulfurase-like protein [Lacipirellula limnantheis]QDT71533.1 putative cysteine desulfurase [Lacipirellula limnantheis]
MSRSAAALRPTVATAGRDSFPSTAEIRAQFPALERRHNGRPVAYFDGPGGTQTPRAVAEAMVDYLYHHNANTHWNYPSSAETDAMLARARQAMADFLNAAPDEIYFGANATTLAFHTSRAIGMTLAPGDEIVVTELDHHANVGPWEALARERGVTLRVVRMNAASGTLDWEDFATKVTPRTKLIAIGAASNALGTINDVTRAALLARSVGALTFVDAVHFAHHQLADVKAIGCDFLTCSAYKFYGPHVGVMYARRAVLESLPYAKVAPASNLAPERAETGTLNHEGIAGSEAAINFITSLAGDVGERRERLQRSFDELHERSMTLLERMWRGLAAIDGVTLYGPQPDAARTSTLSFTVAGVPSSEAARRLAEQGVFVSHGDFYAMTVVERLGLAPEGLIRAGCACYTTEEEVDRLVAGVLSLN